MSNMDILLQSKVTERILKETESSIAEIERMLRKPLPHCEFSRILSLYARLASEREAYKKIEE